MRGRGDDPRPDRPEGTGTVNSNDGRTRRLKALKGGGSPLLRDDKIPRKIPVRTEKKTWLSADGKRGSEESRLHRVRPMSSVNGLGASRKGNWRNKLKSKRESIWERTQRRGKGIGCSI